MRWSTDAIISKTADSAITRWNLAAERLYGYTAIEAIGQHISLIVPVDKRSELPVIMAALSRGEAVERQETVR
jgi:PAS domain S-box-containing protein